MLTDQEREVVRLAGELWGKFCAVVGNDRSRAADLREHIVHIHAIQQAVMSNAAGRAYPEDFRLLGETFDPRADDGEPFHIHSYPSFRRGSCDCGQEAPR